MNKISHGQKLFLSRLRRHRLIVRLAPARLMTREMIFFCI